MPSTAKLTVPDLLNWPGTKTPTASVMRITPVTAENWLHHVHPRNRDFRPRKVRQYARDMKAGKFYVTDQAISFDVDRRLVNGRHRLVACVYSDATIEQLVMWNLPREAFLVIDGGLRRTTDDHFQIAGRDYPYHCGATVRKIVTGLRPTVARSITDLEVDEIMQKWGASVAFAHQVLPGGPGNWMAHSSIRAVVARAHGLKHAEEVLSRFAHVLRYGTVNSRKENAALVLRGKLQDLRAEHGSIAAHGTARAKLYAMTEGALSAFLEGAWGQAIEPAKEELFRLPGEGTWLKAESLDEKAWHLGVQTA